MLALILISSLVKYTSEEGKDKLSMPFADKMLFKDKKNSWVKYREKNNVVGAGADNITASNLSFIVLLTYLLASVFIIVTFLF